VHQDDIGLKDIQRLTGHNTLDGVRMALKRAEVRSCGLLVGNTRESWPPCKMYRTEEVWRVFGDRITANAEGDEEIRAKAWKAFSCQIRDVAAAPKTHEVFRAEMN